MAQAIIKQSNCIVYLYTDSKAVVQFGEEEDDEDDEDADEPGTR